MDYQGPSGKASTGLGAVSQAAMQLNKSSEPVIAKPLSVVQMSGDTDGAQFPERLNILWRGLLRKFAKRDILNAGF